MKNTILFISFSLLLTGCKNDSKDQAPDSERSSSTNESISTRIASAHGFDNFKDVDQLQFTFNVKVNDSLRSSRTWKWIPKEERVELTEKDQTSSYVRDGEYEEDEKALDQKFINDTYWFLFPFQLVWSEYEMEHNENVEAPISKELMQELVVKYAGDGGYTPGDTYHIYFKDDNIIKEWTYVSSGGRTLSTTWEEYENFNGLSIAKMHKSEDGSFQLYFSGIEVIK